MKEEEDQARELENAERQERFRRLSQEDKLALERESCELHAKCLEHGWMEIDANINGWACLTTTEAWEMETGQDLGYPITPKDMLLFFEEYETPVVQPIWMIDQSGPWTIQWANPADARIACEKGTIDSFRFGKTTIKMRTVPVVEDHVIRAYRARLRMDDVNHLNKDMSMARRLGHQQRKCRERTEAEQRLKENEARQAREREAHRLLEAAEAKRKEDEEADLDSDTDTDDLWYLLDPVALPYCISRMQVLDEEKKEKIETTQEEMYVFFEQTEPDILTPVTMALRKGQWFCIWRSPDEMWKACDKARSQSSWKMRPATIVCLPVSEHSLVNPIVKLVQEGEMECETKLDVEERHRKETERRELLQLAKLHRDQKKNVPESTPKRKKTVKSRTRVTRNLDGISNPATEDEEELPSTFAGGAGGGDDGDGDGDDDDHRRDRSPRRHERGKPKISNKEVEIWQPPELDILGTSILTGKNRIGYPRLSTFRGSKPEKGDATYTQWRYEIFEAMDEYTESIVREAVRRSVRGIAKDRLRQLGKVVKLKIIIQKFDMAFGTSKAFDVLMREFYRVVQHENEDVTAYSTRLENTLESIQIQWPERMTEELKEMEHRERFYHGLREQFLVGLEYVFENEDKTFDDLFRAARKAESSQAARVVEQKTRHDRTKAKAKLGDAHHATVVPGYQDWLFDKMRTEVATLVNAGNATHTAEKNKKKKHKKKKNRGTASDTGESTTDVQSLDGRDSAAEDEFDNPLDAQVGEAQANVATGGAPAAGAQTNFRRCFKCQGFGHFARECVSRDADVPSNARALNEQQRPGNRAPRASATQQAPPPQ